MFDKLQIQGRAWLSVSVTQVGCNGFSIPYAFLGIVPETLNAFMMMVKRNGRWDQGMETVEEGESGFGKRCIANNSVATRQPKMRIVEQRI